MINTFSIKEEKFINQTYYVNMGVSFEKKKIFEYLEKKNIFPTQIIKETFLYLPIIIEEDINDILIFSDNIIYKNWNRFNKKSQLINYLLPTEDLEDINLIKKNLMAKGIFCGGGVYEVPCHLQPVFENVSHNPADLKITEAYCPRHICPPITSGTTIEDAERIALELVYQLK